MAEGGVVQARRHMAESPPDPHGSLLMTPGLDLARPVNFGAEASASLIFSKPLLTALC